LEDDEEKDDTIPNWTQGVAFADDTMEDDAQGDEMGETQGVDDALAEVLREAKEECETVKESKKLERMLEDHKKPLYPDCKEGHKKLGSALEMLQWKARNRVSDMAFDELLLIVKEVLGERIVGVNVRS
jgi:hypothetical protein